MIKKINGKDYFIFYRENTSDIKTIREKQQYFNRDFYPVPEELWIDAGANIGLIKMLMDSYSVESISLEPLEDNFKLLSANTSENNLKGKNIMVGLGFTGGELDFYIPADGDYWRATTINHYKRKEVLQTKVKIITLDEIDADCLKMDIEGSEIEILENYDLSRFKKICFEYHFDKDKSINRFKNIIHKLGDLFNVWHSSKNVVEKYDIFPKNIYPNSIIVRCWR